VSRHAGTRRVLGGLVAALLAAIAVVLAVMPIASATNELVASIPGNNYTVDQMPVAAQLTFASPVSEATNVNVTAAGNPLPVTSVAGAPNTVTVDMTGVPAAETVKLAWRVVDQATHVNTGVLSFHVLDHATGGAAATPAAAPAALPGLVSTIPADGYTVSALPALAKFNFAKPTKAAGVTVNAAGKSLPVKDVAGTPNTVTVDLTGVVPTETVKLVYRTKDVAGQVTSGVLSFHVLDHADAAATGGVTPAGKVDDLHGWSVISHVSGYLAMAVLLGGLFFVSLLWPAGAQERRTRLLLGGATFIGGGSAIASIYIATQQVSPLSFRDAIDQDFGRISVSVALMWLLASLLLVAMFQFPETVRKAPWRFSAVVVAVGLIRTIGMSAHGAQGTHPTIGLIVDFLHLSAVSAWVGGLAVMSVGLLPRRQLGEIATVVPRFSKVAATSVALVIASGVLLAWQVVGSFHGLWSTHYGHVLLVKVALVGFVLMAALASKRWVEKTLAHAVSTDRTGAIGSFVASVSAETVLVIAVLGAASLLVTSSPGL
jgi:copper transport protein